MKYGQSFPKLTDSADGRHLRTHRRQQGEQRLKVGADYQPNDLVFATKLGAPLLPRNLLRRHFKPILVEAGLPESIRLYDFVTRARHYY